MTRQPIITLGLTALLLSCLPAPARATKEWAAKTGRRCTACHLTVSADAPLNPLGRSFRDNSHSFALAGDDLEKVPSKGPLTETEQKMLMRRYLLKGQAIFGLDKIGTEKVSCATCHKPAPDPSNLVGVWARYPRWHAGLNRMADLEDAVNHCIEARMHGSILRPGTPSSLAMQIYLKSLR